MSNLEYRFRDGLPFAERLLEAGLLVSDCHWVADALEKSMSTNIAHEDKDVNERCERVAATLGLLLDFAADRLFNLHCEFGNASNPESEQQGE
jgi:hypothetical protein